MKIDTEAAYFAELERYRAAFRTFDAIRNQYRARTVDDAEFLAARATFDAAAAALDLAESEARNA